MKAALSTLELGYSLNRAQSRDLMEAMLEGAEPNSALVGQILLSLRAKRKQLKKFWVFSIV